MRIEHSRCWMLLVILIVLVANVALAQQSDGFRLELANGKVCKLSEFTRLERMAIMRIVPKTGVPIRVQGTIRVAQWGDKTSARGSSVELRPTGSEKAYYPTRSFVPRDLNPAFTKALPNEYPIDSIFYVPAPFEGGQLELGDLTVPLPPLSPPDSITRPQPNYQITGTELLREIKGAYDSDWISYDGMRELTTIKPIVGAILKVSLAPVDGSDASIEEAQLELASGGRVLCCGYYVNDKVPFRLYQPNSGVQLVDFTKPPSLYFVVPPATKTFVLHIGEQRAVGTVSGLREPAKPEPAPQKPQEPGLAEIVVQSRSPVSVAKLEANTPRMSGRVAGRITTVGEELAGADFMRVKWQATVSYEIVVTEPGYLYVWKGNKDTRPQTGLTWEPRPEAVRGPYLPGAYRTLVRAQQRIKVGGYELGLVARKIELKKSE